MTVAHKSSASLPCIDVIILTVRYTFMCNILANYFAAYGKKIESIEQTCSQAKLKHLRFCRHQYDQLLRKHLLSSSSCPPAGNEPNLYSFSKRVCGKMLSKRIEIRQNLVCAKYVQKYDQSTDHLPQIH